MMNVINELKKRFPEHEKEITMIGARISILPRSVSDEIANAVSKIMNDTHNECKDKIATMSMHDHKSKEKMSMKDRLHEKMAMLSDIVHWDIKDEDELFEAVYKIMIAGSEREKTASVVLLTECIVLRTLIDFGFDHKN